jgi:hypothetical protein
MALANPSPLLSDWSALIQEAAKLWGPINEQQTAKDELRRIKQEKSVSDYHANFLRWSTISGYNESALAEAFYQGLKDSIKDMMVHIDRPQTVEGILTEALIYEARILTRMRERPKNTNPQNKVNVSGHGRTANAKSMKLSPAERTDLMRKGLCFRCRKSGHLSRNCPDKPKEQIKKTSDKEGEAEEETKEEEKEDF